MLLAALLAVGSVATPQPEPAAAAVSCNIVTGAPGASQQVARLYKAVFNRPPDPRGWNYWKGIRQGSSLFDIADSFVEAPEFTNLYGSAANSEFVRLVYRNVMRREPDTQGYNYWLGLLNRGEIGRADIVVYFSESTEFRRREQELYLESCPTVVGTAPSVISSTGVALAKSSRHAPASVYAYLQTRNSLTASSAHGFIDYGSGDNWVGRRGAGDNCVTWRIVPRSVPGNAVFYSGFVHDNFFGDPRADDPWSITGPDLLFDRIGIFTDRVDNTGLGYPVDSCDPEPDPMAALVRRFTLLPDLPASTVTEGHGMVHRVIVMGTGEIRTLLASNDTSVETLVPTLADDLALVDANNADLRAAGLSELATDRAGLTIDFWEDRTGNVAQAKVTYHLYLTQADLEVWHWVETTLVERIPR